MAKMGLQFGLESGQYCKRQHHWMFTTTGIGDESNSVNSLPPLKSARPHLAFTEMNVHHLIEDVFIPGKPDWKPITVTLFDLVKNQNPIWNWITSFYDPQNGTLVPPNAGRINAGGDNVVGTADDVVFNNKFIRECYLSMLDGCGKVIERWIYEDAWPQQINFQTLDYGQQDVMMVDITLRYARAYIQ